MGMGEKDSMENLDCIAGLAFRDLSESFKLIEEDYPKVSVFVEMDETAENIWKQYQDMQSEMNHLERTKKYLKMKKCFSEYVISIPKKYAATLINEKSEIGYISIDVLPNYYDLETGFMRAGAGGGSMII
jgi:CRISPR-associated endonuclease/helicase Cas3